MFQVLRIVVLAVFAQVAEGHVRIACTSVMYEHFQLTPVVAITTEKQHQVRFTMMDHWVTSKHSTQTVSEMVTTLDRKSQEI